MNAKTSLVLMVLFIVLGTFAFFDPFGRKEKAEQAKEQEARVFWLENKLVEKITIRGAKVIDLECTKTEGCPFDSGGDWKMTAPVADLADPASVGGLASAVKNLTQSDKLELTNGVDPKEFGFDQPTVELEFRVKGEAELYSLRVGSAKAVGNTAYLQTNRQAQIVFMVPSFFPTFLQKEVFHWRNKRLFPFVTGDAIQAIEWAGPAGKFSAQRENGAWKLTAPTAAPANHAMLGGLASTLVYLDMSSIFAENRRVPEAQKILAKKPDWQISFRGPGEKENRLSLYALPSKEYVAAVAGEERLFRLDGTVIERFNKPAVEYRNRQLIVGDELSGATEIALLFPREKKQIVLKPEGGGWVYTSGDKPAETLSRGRVDGFLRAVSAAEASNFLRDPKLLVAFAKRPADLELEFRASGQVKRRLRFAIHERQSVLTESGQAGELALLAGNFLRLLPVRFGDLYESANKQVITSEPAKAGEHGEHPHSHTH